MTIHALPSPMAWPWVEIITNHVHATAKHVEVLVDAGVDGLVVAGTGNGSISRVTKEALLKAQVKGVEICLASRCNQGPVMQTTNHAFEIAKELNPAKARVALILNILSKKQSHNNEPCA
jgi:L-asparaginase